MLKGTLLQPEILAALAGAGHGARVLIADGNFPVSTKSSPQAKRVYLNLRPGLVSCVDVLQTLCETIPIEQATVMLPPEDGEFAIQRPVIWDQFEETLRQHGFGRGLNGIGRFNFYDQCRQDDVALAIATGEQKIFANLLLTIGVVN